MQISMRCYDAKHKGEEWVLQLGKKGARVLDEYGEVRAEFTRGEAAGSFVLPSFAQSIKHFCVPIDGQIWHFDVSKPEIQQIKSFMDHSVVAAGPAAVQAVQTQAIRNLLIGIAATIGGTVLTVGSLVMAAQQEGGGRYVVTYGLIIYGLVMVGKGIYGFVQHGKLQGMTRGRDESE